MKQTVLFRNAVVEDAALLVELYDKAFLADFLRFGECPAYKRTPERMEESIRRFPKEIILNDNVPVGVLSVQNQGSGNYYIGCLCVIPEYQGKGIGTEAISHFRRMHPDWQSMELVTPVEKEENLRFYQKNGFEIIGRTLDGRVEVAQMQCKRYIKVNEKSFAVKKLLGKGKGGYSYLVCEDKQLFVAKQIHHEPCAYYQFGNKLESELRDYKRLESIGIPMPRLLEVDAAKERILKEYIPGDTIFDLVLRGEMKDSYMEQIKAMCCLLYKNNTNIDYFPTNFVVQEDRLFYVDYECNDYMQKWDFEHWGSQYWSMTDAFRQYVEEQKK